MNRIVLAMIAVIALSGFTTQDSATTTNTPPALTAEDESAVRALVNEFANSWNQHDMKAMHELDTQDVEWINVVGHYWRGKDTVYKGHTAIHKGMEAKSVMKVESVTVLHFVKSAPDYPSTTDTKTRGSYTMVKRDGIWKIVHFQNTVIDPNAEKDDLPKFADTGFPPPGHPLYVSTPK